MVTIRRVAAVLLILTASVAGLPLPAHAGEEARQPRALNGCALTPGPFSRSWFSSSCSPAHATAAPQTIAVTPTHPRQWDVSGSFGGLWTGLGDRPGGYEEWTLGPGVDVGRYWTRHVKTEANVMVLTGRTSFERVSFPVPGLGGGGYYFVDTTLGLTTVSGAATYQFLDNAFAHRYLSGGIRLLWQREHRIADETVYTIGRVGYTAPAVDEHDATALVRPFVAGGFKSYFNERVYVRTEVLAGVDSGGLSHLLLRIGIGADF